jgi:GT2 family glycosyltransferase
MNASPPLKNFPPPKVSIITLNWNTPDLTCQLIDSLKSYLTYENVEIIVVDNGSTIDPTNLVKAIIPEVLVIRNSTNLGFSKGCNIGMQVASGDYLFLLNSLNQIRK